MTDYAVCRAPEGLKRDEFEKGFLKDVRQEWTESAVVDYAVGKAPQKKKMLPLSFALIKTEKDALAWYKHHHPEYPLTVLEVMAKSLAMDRGFGKPEAEKKQQLTIEKKDVTVSFD